MNRRPKAARFAGQDVFRLASRTSFALICGCALFLIHVAAPIFSAHVRSLPGLAGSAADAEGTSSSLAGRMLLQTGSNGSDPALSPQSPSTADNTDVAPVGTPEVRMCLLQHVLHHAQQGLHHVRTTSPIVACMPSALPTSACNLNPVLVQCIPLLAPSGSLSHGTHVHQCMLSITGLLCPSPVSLDRLVQDPSAFQGQLSDST